MRTTLLVPTLDELDAVRLVMPRVDRRWVDQILVVDGGSKDGTVEHLQGQGYAIHRQRGRGYGAGMREALALAEGELIIEFPPDGNSLPDAIPRLKAKAEEGYDLVIASRYKDGARSEDDDAVTALGNRLFTAAVNVLFRARYTDSLVGLRAYRKSAALSLDLDAPGLSWPCQLSARFAAAGLRTAEIPADEPPRAGGKRKMRPLRTGLEILAGLWRDYRWSRRRS